MLQLTDVQVRYRQVFGTKAVSFDLGQAEIIALVGANGAGKSSTLKAIVGLVGYQGAIAFDGKNLAETRSDQMTGIGIGYSPEGRRVFSQLSVTDNLRIGGYIHDRSLNSERMEQIFGYFPRLKERARQQAGSLSGGEQQMLAIGRALMARPRLLLLDEPSLGLAPIVIERIGEVLLEIQVRERLAVVLAEQNAVWAMNIARRTVILELGSVVLSGASTDLQRDPRVREAYLGI